MAEPIDPTKISPEELAERLKIPLKQAEVMIARATGRLKPFDPSKIKRKP